MQDTTSNNKRIAKNTIMLYIRMFISMVVGLYTSRVVLATLGVEDYGIYGVVGGVIGMMGFLNASMSGATSRFLTFELGRGDKDRLAKTFSSALIVHIAIAIIVFILAETVGLWYVMNKLVIPEGRETAAIIVYQFSIFNSMLTITQVPYNSGIIAHEKMGVYAYVEILNVFLKLAIVYLLVIGDFDKLILYSALYFATSLIVMMVYRVYCLRKFSECKFHWIWDKTYLKPLLSFSGWNLFGNFGYIVGNQTSNLVINSFFGVIMNAAAGVALTVCGIVTQFASNTMTAFRPQITKLYAQDNVKEMESLTLLALKAIMILYTIVAIPVFLECDYILGLWLVKVPVLSSLFCRIMLISIFFETMCQIVTIDIHASGNVKLVSAFSGTLFCLAPLFVYILYSFGFSVEWTFIVIALNNAFRLLIYLFILKSYIPQIQKRTYLKTIISTTSASIFTLFTVNYIQSQWADSFAHLITTTTLAIILQIVVFLFIVFNPNQRMQVLQFVQTHLPISHK